MTDSKYQPEILQQPAEEDGLSQSDEDVVDDDDETEHAVLPPECFEDGLDERWPSRAGLLCDPFSVRKINSFSG